MQQQQREEEEEEEEETKGKKRKHDSDAEVKEDSSDEDEKRPKERKIMKRAKNVSYIKSLKFLLFYFFNKKIQSLFSFFADCDINGSESKFACKRAEIHKIRPEFHPRTLWIA